uniref:Uncharacterized protein n=1 Tax=Siphoviridae sp. ct5TL29 TaxID=2825336 RepID=A0A8S5PCZ9_9CAUD|nr:MAG TPA: hypothetical protein [Siphoviridae sp. ct5TL29]
MRCYSRLLYFYFITKGDDVKNFSTLKSLVQKLHF